MQRAARNGDPWAKLQIATAAPRLRRVQPGANPSSTPKKARGRNCAGPPAAKTHERTDSQTPNPAEARPAQEQEETFPFAD